MAIQAQRRSAATIPNQLLFVLPALMIVVMVGCSKSTSPVTGIVTLDDKALPNTMVVFYPVDGGRGNSSAKTDDKGRFALHYTNTEMGAIPGKYKVLVSKTKIVNSAEVETIPVCYNKDSTTIVEVTSSGENYFEFKLNSDGD